MSHQAQASSTGDETAIRELYNELMDGWNKGSGDAFAAAFTEDGDLVGFDGTHLTGREQVASFHQQLFDTYVKGTRLVGKVKDIRFLAPDIAVAHAIGGTIMPGQSDIEPERNSIQTIVAVKRDGTWRIAAFQNTRAQFTGRPEQAEAFTEEIRKLV